MVNYARIQHHIDRGKGIAAKKLGQPFLGYRITGAAAGDFPSGWTALGASNFPLFRRRFAGESKLEMGLKNTALFYDIIANMEPFLLGDVFLQNDPAYVAGVSYGAGATLLPGTLEFNAMCLAWHPPVNKAIGARLDRRVTLWRPASTPATLGDGSKYWKSTHDNDQPLQLSAGSYSFGTAGTTPASWVPAGIASNQRRGDAILGPGVPGMVKPAHWFFYIPPLPGYMPREGDAILDENGARYVIISPFEQQAGVVGYQLLCDREIASSL